MAKGFFLRIGDKTTCGGEIISGSATLRFHGMPGARVGDKVTCGKFSGKFEIVGGLPKRRNEGLLLAGTLHSTSSCPCGSTFLPSIENGYEKKAAIIPETDGFDGWQNPRTDDSEEPEQHAQSARRSEQTQSLVRPSQLKHTPEQSSQSDEKPKREITLTIGVFFDGTGNNAVNTENMLKACNSEHFNLNDKDAQSVLAQCGKRQMGVTGSGATSYTGYYTNVHWLNTLYQQNFSSESTHVQRAIYVEGIGTKAGSPDSTVGLGLGISDTGVVAKTDDAVANLVQAIVAAKDNIPGNEDIVIKTLQFDIFGFSRGAAAARHFANRVFSEDAAIVTAILQGIGDVEYHGMPAGKNRFIGLFDTVAAIGSPSNGLNPHTADTGEVNIVLRPGIAEKVFQITAQNECRFNFASNSIKEAWPELALPGVHSDIGGGYLPQEQENLYLSRPRVETVKLQTPGEQTQIYRQTADEREILNTAPTIAPIVSTNPVSPETWYDDRMPQDRYGNFQKRSFAALTLRGRVVKNDWSKVVLRVMLDAAQEAGGIFEEIQDDDDLTLPSELISFCTKAIAFGKATRLGPTQKGYTPDEIDLIAKDYIHCSANWNAVVTNAEGFLQGGASPAKLISFTNRPDENWTRTVYNMDGKKIWS